MSERLSDKLKKANPNDPEKLAAQALAAKQAQEGVALPQTSNQKKVPVATGGTAKRKEAGLGRDAAIKILEEGGTVRRLGWPVTVRGIVSGGEGKPIVQIVQPIGGQPHRKRWIQSNDDIALRDWVVVVSEPKKEKD